MRRHEHLRDYRVFLDRESKRAKAARRKNYRLDTGDAMMATLDTLLPNGGLLAGPVLIINEHDQRLQRIIADLHHENLHIALNALEEYEASTAIDLRDEEGDDANLRLWTHYANVDP